MTTLIEYGGWVLTPIHIIVCLILIAVVLLQTGKGTDWASALGGGSSQTAFGPRGVENTLSRLTKIAAIVFMVTSLSLALLQTKQRHRDDFGLGLKKAEEELKQEKAASPTPVAGTSPAAEAASEPATPAVAPAAAGGEPPAAAASPAVPVESGSAAPAAVAPAASPSGP